MVGKSRDSERPGADAVAGYLPYRVSLVSDDEALKTCSEQESRDVNQRLHLLFLKVFPYLLYGISIVT